MKREEGPKVMLGNNNNTINASVKAVSEEKKDIVKNLYMSGIGEKFIALQLDIEIPVVIAILKEFNIYQASSSD